MKPAAVRWPGQVAHSLERFYFTAAENGGIFEPACQFNVQFTMKNALGHSLAWLVLAMIAVGFACNGADKLVWHTGEKRVDADIRSWPVERLLEKISAATQWEIYLEPGASHEVSVKFSNLSQDEALARMLGNLSFALLPQTNAPSRFYVFKTTAANATQRIIAPKQTAAGSNDDLIANELIVTLKPGSKMTIEQLAKLLGAKIIGRNDKLNAYRLRFPDASTADAAAESLQDSQDVASTDSNYRIGDQPPVLQVNNAPVPPFNLNPTALGDPNNIVVGLIDTPVQQLADNMQKFILPQVSVAGDSAQADQPMHGTFMAETLLRGVAISSDSGTSRVKILPVDVYGRSSSTTTFEVGAGINAAIAQGATIINLSLGTSGNSPFLETLINNARNQGVLFLAAAGNQPITAPTFPAAYQSVIAVTAGKDGKVDSYANRGSFVDVIAPGTALAQFKTDSYLVTGTSAATAYASGWAAAYKDSKSLTSAQIDAAIRAKSPFNPVTSVK